MLRSLFRGAERAPPSSLGDAAQTLGAVLRGGRHVGLGLVSGHERVDGLGYPNGLKDEAIPLISRIIAVADAYNAMTSDRPYRRRMSDEAEPSVAFWPRAYDQLGRFRAV